VRGEVGHGGHASSPRIRGTRKRSVLGGGRPGQDDVPRQARPDDDVGRKTLVIGTAWVVGGTSSAGGLADPGDRVEDDVELAGEEVELLVGHRQPGQAREVRDLVPGERAHAGAELHFAAPDGPLLTAGT
jgi:hypothetical protein